MVDRYTKFVLTVIAVALTGICVGMFTPRAQAQMAGCGSGGNPCYVSNYGSLPLTVRVQQ